MIPLPVLRYKLKTFGEVGGVHFRQSIDDPASTEIVFLDNDGLDFSSSMGKNVERIFFKENFRRAHHREPGGITELPQVVDFYREGFVRAIDQSAFKKGNFKVVIDFSHSPAGQLLPAILNDMGCEVISLNAYIDQERGIKKAEEKPKSLQQLAKIVASLEAHAGFWLDPSGEAMILVDGAGRVYDDTEALILMVSLVLKTGNKGVFVVPVSAPSAIELLSHQKRCKVRRTKNSERALIEAALSSEVILAASMDGRFAFPYFQSAFDGMFAIARTMELLAVLDAPLAGILKEAAHRAFLQARVTCPLEMKGGIMRKMSEDSLDKEATFIDGIKIHIGEDWVLLLPDQYEPNVQITAEAKELKVAQRLLEKYRKKMEKWKKELG
jgi:mannose-1-phosphate guanylyltransferase/phosphomannomutase